MANIYTDPVLNTFCSLVVEIICKIFTTSISFLPRVEVSALLKTDDFKELGAAEKQIKSNKFCFYEHKPRSSWTLDLFVKSKKVEQKFGKRKHNMYKNFHRLMPVFFLQWLSLLLSDWHNFYKLACRKKCVSRLIRDSASNFQKFESFSQNPPRLTLLYQGCQLSF